MTRRRFSRSKLGGPIGAGDSAAWTMCRACTLFASRHICQFVFVDVVVFVEFDAETKEEYKHENKEGRGELGRRL